MAYKKPSKPYAKKPDGSSYCQLQGGRYDKAWMRFYPIPRVLEGEPVGTHHEMDEELVMGDQRYVNIPNPERLPQYDSWRQVHYRYVPEES